MPAHRLVTGPFPALEPLLFDAIASLKKGDPLAPVEVLAGSNLLAVYLRRAYVEARGAIANLRFLTFLDLARELAPVDDERPPLPPLGEIRLALRALRETPEAARFGPLREREPLARALVNTANDLRDAGLLGPELPVRLPAAGANADRRDFLRDVAATLAAFEKGRAAFGGPETVLLRAARQGVPSTSAPLLVYGLTDLGGLREELLRRAATARPVTAFVPDDGEDDDVNPPVRGRLFARVLGTTARRVSVPFSKPQTFVVGARDDTDEARETVREIVAAHGTGIPLHRMAVLLRHPERQEAALFGELRRLDIPFFRPPGPGFSRTPLGRAASLLVELAATDFGDEPLTELLDVLESLGLATASRAVVHELNVAVGRARWERRIETLRKKLGRIGARLSKLSAFEESFHRVAAAAPEPTPTSWAVWGGRLRVSFAALLGAAPESARLLRAADSLGALGLVDGDTPVPIVEVVAFLSEAFDAEPLAFGQFERDGVAVLSVVSARGLLFDAVFVPGLVERSFPAPSRPDPLLFDDERGAIRRATSRPLPPRSGERPAREERFLWNLATRSARFRVVLLAARHDALRDLERLPSPFLREALRAGASERRLPLGRTDLQGPSLGTGEVWRRAAARGSSVPRTLCPELGRSLGRAAARKLPRFTEFEGLLPCAPRRRFWEEPLSASKLEKFAACAYQTFFGQLLRLRTRDDDEPPFTPDRLTLGVMVHGALRELARRETRLFAISDGRIGTLARELAATEVAAWAETTRLPQPRVFLDKAEGLLVDVLKEVVRHERGRAERLPVAGSEVRFGPPPFDRSGSEEDVRLSVDQTPSLEIGGQTFRFSGRIDRLDRDGEVARVVDYKLSKPAPYGKSNKDRHRIVGGERLQLPLYALAARQLGATYVTSEYAFLVRTDDGRGHELLATTFDERETAAMVNDLKTFVALFAAAAEGRYLPRTDSRRTEHPCGFCDFRSICGPGHERVYERKWAADGFAGRVLDEMRELR